jgi:hypothetical protein
MTWKPQTLRDRSAAHSGNEKTRCRCGRTTQADMMVYIPPALQASLQVPPYLCDGCRERYVRDGRLTKRAWLEAVGAPADVLDRHGAP